MLQLQLFIKTPITTIEGENNDFQKVEMFKDESVTLTQTIQDIKDISKIFTDYSQTFSVPASKTNNIIFKHFYDYYIDGFDARDKKDAALHLNYKPFKTGKIKLEGATLKNNKPHTYRLTFYGSSSNLKDLFGNIKLKGLTYFIDSDFDYSGALVKNYSTNTQDVVVSGVRWTDSMVFPLITHTHRLYFDSGTDGANADNKANVRWNPTGNTAQGVEYKQLKPAIRVMMLFKAIEHQFPEIVFGDDFIKNNNERLYNLFMWLNIKEGNLIEPDDPIYTYLKNFTNVWRSNKAENKASEFCNLTASGTIEILQGRKTKVLDGSISSSTGSEKYNIIVRREGEVVYQEDDLTGTSNITGLELQPGKHTLEVGGTAAATFTANMKVTAFYSGRDAITTWTATGSTFATEKFSIKDNLPDMKILDFLTGMFKMFNLTAFVDDDGITQVRTLDSFFAGTTATPVVYHDITKYVDVKKTQINTVVPFNQIELKYEGTKNFFADDHEERFGVSWGALKYKDSKFDGKKFEIKIPFGHFKFERLYDQSNNGASTSIMWGWGANKDGNATVDKPLLFYPIKATNVSTGFQTPTSISYIGTSGHEELTTYYIPSNSVKLDTSETLNFGAEINEFSLRPFKDGLFNDFYKTYIQDVFKVERRITKLDAFIPLAIITKLQLFDRLIIGDKVFKINKITTNFENLKSSLELINVFDERQELRNLQESISTIDNDIKSAGTTADSSLVTVDAGIDYEIISESPIKEVPLTIPNNTPTPIGNTVCPVTEATLTHPTQQANTNSSVNFSHTISAMGKICNVNNLESYGFVYADTSGKLIGTDLDTIIAVSGVSTIKYETENKISLSNNKEYSFTLTGLSQGDIKYWRFFARTNTTSNFTKVDSISDIHSATAQASVVYSQTTNVQIYNISADNKFDGSIRTVRIMDAGGNLVDYTGLLFGHWSFYSKIVPFIVEGNAATFTTSSGTIPFFGLGTSIIGGVLYYHSTDLQVALNAAKSYGVGDTGATKFSPIYFEVRNSEADLNTHVLAREGISLYTDITSANTKVPDGFYANFEGSIFETNGLEVLDWTPYLGVRADLPNSGMARGVSVQVVNGIVTNRVTYKTK